MYILRQEGYKLENIQEFKDPHPTLHDLCVIVKVVTENIPDYTLWPVCLAYGTSIACSN
jgi:hypothetical protein